jgi:hypothetical protein
MSFIGNTQLVTRANVELSGLALGRGDTSIKPEIEHLAGTLTLRNTRSTPKPNALGRLAWMSIFAQSSVTLVDHDGAYDPQERCPAYLLNRCNAEITWPSAGGLEFRGAKEGALIITDIKAEVLIKNSYLTLGTDLLATIILRDGVGMSKGYFHIPVGPSSTIDRGSCHDIDGDAVSSDLRGIERPMTSGCDVGPYESFWGGKMAAPKGSTGKTDGGNGSGHPPTANSSLQVLIESRVEHVIRLEAVDDPGERGECLPSGHGGLSVLFLTVVEEVAHLGATRHAGRTGGVDSGADPKPVSLGLNDGSHDVDARYSDELSLELSRALAAGCKFIDRNRDGLDGR